MTLDLSEEQQRALQQTRGECLRLKDPLTAEEYVLVRAPIYDRLKSTLIDDPDTDPCMAYPLIDESFREGWDDARMSEYDRYEEYRGRRPCP